MPPSLRQRRGSRAAAEEAYDLAIRFGDLPDSRPSARKLMANRRFLCASPAYLKKAGAPPTPAKLHRHLDFVVAEFAK